MANLTTLAGRKAEVHNLCVDLDRIMGRIQALEREGEPHPERTRRYNGAADYVGNAIQTLEALPKDKR